MTAEAAARGPRLSIVIPAYDESLRIGAALEAVARHCDGRQDVEVVVVDDGSRDDTQDVARAAAERLGLRLRLLRHTPNRGKGFAVRRGMLEAEGEVVLFMDADLAVPVATADRFVARIAAGADVVIGSRRAEGARIKVHQGWLRERLGTAFRSLARSVVLPDVSDFTCGFKAFRRGAARQVFSRQRLWGWGFDAEIMLIAARLGLVVAEEAVEWSDDGRTRVRLLRDVCRSALDLLRIRWNDARGCYRREEAPRLAESSAE